MEVSRYGRREVTYPPRPTVRRSAASICILLQAERQDKQCRRKPVTTQLMETAHTPSFLSHPCLFCKCSVTHSPMLCYRAACSPFTCTVLYPQELQTRPSKPFGSVEGNNRDRARLMSTFTGK